MKIQFVDHWVTQLKNRISIKVAAVFAVVVGLLTANPIIVVGLIGFLPDGIWKWVVALGVAIIVFAIPTLVSLIKQPKLQEKLEQKDAEKPYAER